MKQLPHRKKATLLAAMLLAGGAVAAEKPVINIQTITTAELPKLEAECQKLSETAGKTYQLVTGKVWSDGTLDPNSIIDCFGDAECIKDNPPSKIARYSVVLTHTNVSAPDKRIGISTGFVPIETIPDIDLLNNRYYGICAFLQTNGESTKPFFGIDRFDFIRQLEK